MLYTKTTASAKRRSHYGIFIKTIDGTRNMNIGTLGYVKPNLQNHITRLIMLRIIVFLWYCCNLIASDVT